MKKKFATAKRVGIAGLLALLQLLSAAIPAAAAEVKPEEATVTAAVSVAADVQNGVGSDLIPSCVADIFDPEYYMERYPDVKAAVGSDPQALLEHFLTIGLKEGRVGSPVLDIAKYRKLYPDLAAAFGDNWDLYVRHYFTLGIAQGRSNGMSEQAVVTRSKRIAYDSEGNILVPWEDVTGEGDSGKTEQDAYLTLESLRALCGNSLVLLLDKDGNPTFVGGNFSQVTVTDSETARQSLSCMMKLLQFPEDTAALYLTHSNTASNGDHYYRFSAQDKETGYLYSSTDIIVGADQNGKVLCMSSSSGTRYYTELSRNEINWEKVHGDMKAKGFTLLSAEPVLKYDAETNQYAWVEYYSKGSLVAEYYRAASGDLQYGYDTDNIRYYGQMPEEGAYSFDYFFENNIQTLNMEFTDQFKNTVTLPVAYEEGKGYYFLDKGRHIVGIGTIDWNRWEEAVMPYYFSDPSEVPSHYISALQTVRSCYDTYQELGLFADPKTILFSFDSNDLPYASASLGYGAFMVSVYDNPSNAAFDVLSHEFAHGVLGMITGGLAYKNKTGAINEAYADILGNLLEMMVYEDGANIGDVDTEQWLIREAVDNGKYTLRNMKDPSQNGQPDQVGGNFYVVDADDAYAKLSFADYGGVHVNSGVLNRICYRMHTEAGIPMKDLFLLWYDTLQQLTEDSNYESIRGYMEYTLRRHNMADKIDMVNQVFEEARVAQAADTWKELEAAEGATKVILRFRHLPEDLPEDLPIEAKLIVGGNKETEFNGGNYTFFTRDKNKTFGTVTAKGTNIQKIYFFKNTETITAGYVTKEGGCLAGEEDVELTVDYQDVLAAALTRNAVQKPDDYQDQFVEATISVTPDTEKPIADILVWKIFLNREMKDEEGLDVSVTISGMGDWSEESTTVVLRKDSSYGYYASVKDWALNTWEKQYSDLLSTSGDQPVTLELVFTADENDGWVLKQAGPYALPEENEDAAPVSEDSTAAAVRQEIPEMNAEDSSEAPAETPESSTEEESTTTESAEESTETPEDSTAEEDATTEPTEEPAETPEESTTAEPTEEAAEPHEESTEEESTAAEPTEEAAEPHEESTEEESTATESTEEAAEASEDSTDSTDIGEAA